MPTRDSNPRPWQITSPTQLPLVTIGPLLQPEKNLADVKSFTMLFTKRLFATKELERCIVHPATDSRVLCLIPCLRCDVIYLCHLIESRMAVCPVVNSIRDGLWGQVGRVSRKKQTTKYKYPTRETLELALRTARLAKTSPQVFSLSDVSKLTVSR